MTKKYKFSEITRRRMSEAHTGKPSEALGKHWILSEEVKQRMKKPKSERHRENISKARLGMKFTENHKKNLKLAKQLHPYHPTQEIKRKIRLARVGSHPTEETKEKIRNKRTFQVIPFKDTQPELKIQTELSARKIYFQPHKSFRLSDGTFHQVDLFLAPNICIEADGDYWHSLERAKARDYYINIELQKMGMIVMRFWEHDINNNVKAIVNKIEDMLNKKEAENEMFALE